MMNRKIIFAAAAVVSLSLSAPAFADVGAGHDGNTALDITNRVTSTIGNIGLTFSPSYTSNKTVNVTKVSADQDLRAVNVNHGMHSVVDIDEDHGYDSGGNSVSGGAFAAFAGILNQAWNTGNDANDQAANNHAVQGNTHFNN
jgi:hypothetical protein